MTTVFADTGYSIALLNPFDELHAKAGEESRRLSEARIVTSEMVLAEWLNDFGRRGERLRHAAGSFVRRLLRGA